MKRREVIKNAAIGLVWMPPVVQSVILPAHAATSPGGYLVTCTLESYTPTTPPVSVAEGSTISQGDFVQALFSITPSLIGSNIVQVIEVVGGATSTTIPNGIISSNTATHFSEVGSGGSAGDTESFTLVINGESLVTCSWVVG